MLELAVGLCGLLVHGVAVVGWSRLVPLGLLGQDFRLGFGLVG